MSAKSSVNIDRDLELRLSALAEKRGWSVSDLAQDVLRAHVDAAERYSADLEEDEHRWQRYLETGAAVPVEQVRTKLRKMAADAAVKG